MAALAPTKDGRKPLCSLSSVGVPQRTNRLKSPVGWFGWLIILSCGCLHFNLAGLPMAWRTAAFARRTQCSNDYRSSSAALRTAAARDSANPANSLALAALNFQRVLYSPGSVAVFAGSHDGWARCSARTVSRLSLFFAIPNGSSYLSAIQRTRPYHGTRYGRSLGFGLRREGNTLSLRVPHCS